MSTRSGTVQSWADEQGPQIAFDLANAITLAQRVHHSRYRRSGDPYITHPIAVALIVAEYGADPATVITAVLHDIEDVSTQDAAEGLTHDTALRATFGDAIVDLLGEVTALDRSGPTPSPDTIDQRALAIKVADRLHNMRTIRHLRPDKQQRKATHTSAVVAPLARRLGMTAIGDELDTLSAATLRAHDRPRPSASRRTIGAARTVSFRALHGTLRAAVRVLPAHCRARWIQEWEGELCAAADFRGRLRFAADVLRGLPTMAVLTRRSSPR